MRDFWNFYSSNRIIFGRGGISRLGSICAKRGWRNIFVVSDPQIDSAGHVSSLSKSVCDSGTNVRLFLGGVAEPSVDLAIECIEQAQHFVPDVIVGLGGGSNMDLAKIVSCGVTFDGSPEDYFGFGKVPGPTIPTVCIPTTSGTGSEVTHAAVLTDNNQNLKVSTLSPFFRPEIALVDPELTISCPKHVTAESGMDALTHAIEAYTNVHYYDMPVPNDVEMPYDGKNPMADIFAEKAIRLIGSHIENAVHNPDDMDAKSAMSLAATLAGLAFSNAGVALVHGLEYPIGGAHYCSHGAGNALLLPFMMEFNRPEREKEMANIANWLGVHTTGMDLEMASKSAIEKVSELKKTTGIPMRLREFGIDQSELEEFAEKTSTIDRLMQLNPRKATKENLLEILTSAY